MRVKVGDTWYEAKIGQPIMVELSDHDKENISNMPPDKYRYAEFEENVEDIVEAHREWMKT